MARGAHLDTTTVVVGDALERGARKPRKLAAGTAALRSVGLRPASFGGFQPPVLVVVSRCARPPARCHNCPETPGSATSCFNRIAPDSSSSRQFLPSSHVHRTSARTDRRRLATTGGADALNLRFVIDELRPTALKNPECPLPAAANMTTFS